MSASSSPQGVPTGWDFFVGRWRRRARMGLRIVRHISDHGCYVNRDYLVLPDKKLIYAANCKVASSSIKSCLTGIQADNYRQVVQLTKKSDVYQRNINIDDYPGYFLFSFVRNPFSRLVSLYENKYHHDMSLDGHERVYPYFDRYLFGYLSKDRGFKAFAKRACGIPEWLADPHFASQVFILVGQKRPFFARLRGEDGGFARRFRRIAGKVRPARLAPVQRHRLPQVLDGPIRPEDGAAGLQALQGGYRAVRLRRGLPETAGAHPKSGEEPIAPANSGP